MKQVVFILALAACAAWGFDRDPCDTLDYLVHVEYRDELITRIDTVRARSVIKGGSDYYVALVDGTDLWADRARIIKRVKK